MRTLPRWQRPVAALATGFGVVTILVGGAALFGGDAAARAAGDAVPLVLWFNFLAGFFYVAGGIAIWRNAPWAVTLSWLIGLGTLAVFAVFLALVGSGTAFEARTVAAMILRSGFWLALARALSRRRLRPV